MGWCSAEKLSDTVKITDGNKLQQPLVAPGGETGELEFTAPWFRWWLASKKLRLSSKLRLSCLDLLWGGHSWDAGHGAGLPIARKPWKRERVQQKAVMMMKDLEHLSYRRPSELGMFNLQMRGL